MKKMSPISVCPSYCASIFIELLLCVDEIVVIYVYVPCYFQFNSKQQFLSILGSEACQTNVFKNMDSSEDLAMYHMG